MRIYGSDYLKIYQPDVYVTRRGGHWITAEFLWEVHDHWAKGVWSVITGFLGLETQVFPTNIRSLAVSCRRVLFWNQNPHCPYEPVPICALSVSFFFFHLTKGVKIKVTREEDKRRMEVRYNQDADGMVLKNGLKEGKDNKETQGSLSKSFLKEQQGSFSPSGTLDNCEKNRGNAGDPDYCRRILVRGTASLFLFFCLFFLYAV